MAPPTTVEARRRRESGQGRVAWRGVPASEPRLGLHPCRVVVEREEPLDLGRAVGIAAEQHLEGLADAGPARVRGGGARLRAAIDAVEDGREVEQPGAGVEEELIEGASRGKWHHGAPSPN